MLNWEPTNAATIEPTKYCPSTPMLKSPILKPTATAIAEMYNGIERLIIDTIDLPLIPYSNIIWKVSIGSLPMNNKIRELSPNEIANAIIGAEKGYEKILELVGVGYRAALKGTQLNLQLGFSHDINFDIPEDVKILVEKQTTIKISGVDKQKVGMIASKIKSFRPPEPYKGKGIKEKGQYILRKEGKKK